MKQNKIDLFVELFEKGVKYYHQVSDITLAGNLAQFFSLKQNNQYVIKIELKQPNVKILEGPWSQQRSKLMHQQAFLNKINQNNTDRKIQNEFQSIQDFHLMEQSKKNQNEKKEQLKITAESLISFGQVAYSVQMDTEIIENLQHIAGKVLDFGKQKQNLIPIKQKQSQMYKSDGFILQMRQKSRWTMIVSDCFQYKFTIQANQADTAPNQQPKLTLLYNQDQRGEIVNKVEIAFKNQNQLKEKTIQQIIKQLNIEKINNQQYQLFEQQANCIVQVDLQDTPLRVLGTLNHRQLVLRFL